MDTEDKIKYWQEMALDDLDSAEIMLEGKKYLQSGFYCHQAIEKILKCYFVFMKKKDPPYTHNLIKLSKDSGIDKLINTDQRDHIDFLMPLNIEARYPDEKTAIMKTLDYSKSRIIYERTEELLKWIQKLIMQ